MFHLFPLSKIHLRNYSTGSLSVSLSSTTAIASRRVGICRTNRDCYILNGRITDIDALLPIANANSNSTDKKVDRRTKIPTFPPNR